jgi:DNA-binding beta-propeller fold protein YncE
VSSVFANGSGLSSPNGIAFDSAGNLFVANEGSNTIFRFTPGGLGSVFADASDGLSSPSGIAFDSVGNLFVANQTTIEKFTPGGIGSVFADASDGLTELADLAFDGSGNLYAVNYSPSLLVWDSTIVKFTPDGVDSLFPAPFFNGAGYPYGTRTHLVFTDDAGVPVLQPGGKLIPEPSTWGLLGLGLPALLGLRRPR